MFLQHDFGIGRHVGFQHAFRIVDGDADFESGDVVFLDAHGRDLVYFSGEGLVFVGLDFDAGGLSHINLADVTLVNLALYIDFAGVAERHYEGSGGT